MTHHPLTRAEAAEAEGQCRDTARECARNHDETGRKFWVARANQFGALFEQICAEARP